MLSRAKSLAVYTLIDYLCLANLSIWTFFALKFTLLLSLKVNAETSALETDWSNHKVLLAAVVGSLAVDFLWHLVTPRTEALPALGAQLLWMALLVVSTAISRVKWLGPSKVTGLDAAKARMISSAMICTVAPCLVYLSNRSPTPYYLGDFSAKTTTYGCLAANVAVVIGIYFALETLSGSFEDLARKMVV